jgi:hypothetical protein
MMFVPGPFRYLGEYSRQGEYARTRRTLTLIPAKL